MLKHLAVSLLYCASAAFGGTILFPSTLTFNTTASTGASFVFNGTLTQNDTIDFTVSGNPCLQGAAYCVNGAGVVVVRGTTDVGGTSAFNGTFNGTNRTWNFGSLLMSISGVSAVQVFPATAANGLTNTINPPTSLSLPTTSLTSLGFANFSVTNPTISFFMADTLYSDNNGSYTLSQSAPGVPEPGTLLIAGAGLAALALFRRRQA